MRITVCKFGGSSMADAGMFVRVRRIIDADPARRYIILSAPGKRCPQDQKITDLLLRAHAADSMEDYSILAQIFARYASLRRSLAPSFPLEAEFARIRRRLHASPDYAASRGEYLCAKLFSAYSGLTFVDAAELIFFREDGTVDMPKSRRAVREKLLVHPRAVIPGFYGTGADGGIRTFPRGGSDVSGALIAALADADLYENWTDVDGLFTADPGIVRRPLRNHRVSLAQMRMICRAGARLLHPDALSPLEGTGIDTEIKNTFRPDAAGTRISEGCAETVKCVTGEITGDQAAVRVFGLTEKQAGNIGEMLKPIHIINMLEYMEYIIHAREFETAVQQIHEIIIH